MNASDNPYQTKRIDNANGPTLKMNTRDQEYMKSEDELNAKADPTIVFPLETLVQFVGNMLVTLTQARSALNIAGDNPAADKQVLADVIEKLDRVNVELISIPEDLEKLSL